MAGKNAVQAMKQIMEFMSKGPGYDRVLKGVQVVGGGPGRCICEFTVKGEHQNRANALHGGFTATLVDVVSTTALMSTERALGIPGVSVDMNITYMKAAKEGDEVVVDASALKVGRTLAFLTVDIKHKKDDSLIAQGRHTKFIGGS